MRIAFEGVLRPVEFSDCEMLLEGLRSILPDWPFREAPAGGLDPEVRVAREGEEYRLTTPWSGRTSGPQTLVSAIASLLVEVVWAFVEDAAFLCLHCGAAEFAGRLVVFPSTYRAGKSTLIARLAAAGVRIYADDVLPIDGADERAVAPGVAPRLRLPLPERSSEAFRHFVGIHGGPTDGYYLYLDLPDRLHARHGEKAPIGAFVLLERQDDQPAALFSAARGEVLQRVIRQNFGRLSQPQEIVDRLHGIVERTPCFTLRYSDLDHAATLLQDVFRSWPPNLPDIPLAPQPLQPVASVLPARGRQRQLTAPYEQNPAVTLRAVDGELFLVHPQNPSIFHLNAVGAGLWNLLQEPATMAEAIGIFQAIFTDQDPLAIKRDVTALFFDLKRNDLVVRSRPKSGV